MFQSGDIECMPPQLKLQIHFTSFRDNIYQLCLWMPDERSCLISTSKHVLKLRYRAHAEKCKPLVNFTESLERDDIKRNCI